MARLASRFVSLFTALRVGSACVAISGLMAAVVLLFFPALTGSFTFGYRDAAHYYYPYFHYIHRQRDEWLPLWNPLDEIGRPLLADPTASILYPGKLILLLPVSYTLAYNLYVVTHIGLAAVTALAVARAWGCSISASCLAGAAFGLSGHVLAQHANVPYLVGAAWLPLVLLSADRMLRRRELRWSVLTATTVSMIVLGGDIQTAYHGALMVALYAVIMRRGSSRRRTQTSDGNSIPSADDHSAAGQSQDGRVIGSPSCLLLITGLAVVLLTAAQWFPTWQWTRRCDRFYDDAPRSIWELGRVGVRSTEGREKSTASSAKAGQPSAEQPEAAATDPSAGAGASNPQRSSLWAGLFSPPAAGTHRQAIYEFSIAPWRVAELLWPNASGRRYPVYQRWLDMVPAEGRVWASSLYMGLIPALFGVSGLRIRGGDVRQRWLSSMVLLAGLSALGWYGIGWLINEVASMLGRSPDSPLAWAPAGGLYWWLVAWLPGYALFRYPAKWWTFVALGLSVLAAWQMDRWQAKRRTVTVAGWCIMLSGALAILIIALRQPLERWFRTIAADPLFGPIDAAGAVDTLLHSALHAALVAAVLVALSRYRRAMAQRPLGPPHSFQPLRHPCENAPSTAGTNGWCRAVVCVVTIVDLTIANRRMIQYVPAARLEAACQQAVTQRIAVEGPAITRIYRPTDLPTPPAWRVTASAERMREIQSWEFATLHPKYHLLVRRANVQAMAPFSFAEYRAVCDVLLRAPAGLSTTSDDIATRWLHYLDVRWVVGEVEMRSPSARTNSNSPGKRSAHPIRGTMSDSDRMAHHADWSDTRRTWIVHKVHRLPELHTRCWSDVLARTREALWDGGTLVDLRQTAIVESDDFEPGPPAAVDASTLPQTERCQIIREEPEQIQIDARLRTPGLVVLADAYAPGWCCEVRQMESGRTWVARLVRTDRVFRGVYLPAGSYRLSMQYRPYGVRMGVVVSSVSWFVALAALIGTIVRKPNE